MTQPESTVSAAANAGNMLISRLRDDCADAWRDYTHHPFVAGIQDGSLPEAAFRFYLRQDYLFLIHFARAYALAAFKAENLEDMRSAAATLTALVDVETSLHVEYCKGWGVSLAEMEATEEAPACVAYTRLVLDKGMQGDLLDLQVALAPCVVGYGVIGQRLLKDPNTCRDGNPYQSWMEMYGGADYWELVVAAEAQLDRLFAARGSEARYPSLKRTFEAATRMEVGFWQMGWDAGK